MSRNCTAEDGDGKSPPTRRRLKLPLHMSPRHMHQHMSLPLPMPLRPLPQPMPQLPQLQLVVAAEAEREEATGQHMAQPRQLSIPHWDHHPVAIVPFPRPPSQPEIEPTQPTPSSTSIIGIIATPAEEMCRLGTAARRAPPSAANPIIRSDATGPTTSSIWTLATGQARRR